MNDRKKQAKFLRAVRKIHRTTGAFLFILFFIVSITGLMLGWKKNSNGYILPKSEIGVSKNLSDWLPIDTLQTIAFKAMQDSVDQNIDLEIFKIDVRPQKGMVKFIFKNHYSGVQLDGSTGKILTMTKRRSDLVENIHDGSALDRIFKTDGEIIKLIYTTITGLALLTFTITGFWLWYGPIRMRRINKKRKV